MLNTFLEIIKQQGHSLTMTTIAYSKDGQYIASGSFDGKVKVWNTNSGFCFVTFSEHTGPISAVCFSPKQAIFSSSLDGTVRAFDLNRYRNFRTFTSPTPNQFTALALDPAGEVVCAAAKKKAEIFIWDVQTGKILEILTAGESIISDLCFNPIEV